MNSNLIDFCSSFKYKSPKIFFTLHPRVFVNQGPKSPMSHFVPHSLKSLLAMGLGFALLSCDNDKVQLKDNKQVFTEYSELFDLAEKSDSDGLSKKLNEMDIGDHFHLKKFNEIQAQRQVIEECNQFIDQQKFDSARELLEQHIAAAGSSPSINRALIILSTVANLDTYRSLSAELTPQEAEVKLTIMRSKFKIIFAKNDTEILNFKKMDTWFNQEFKRLNQLALNQISTIRDISLIQLDAMNIAMKQSTTQGLAIYCRYLNKLAPSLDVQQTRLGHQLINFTKEPSRQAASITQRVVEISQNTAKQSLANTISALSTIHKQTPLDSKLRQQVLKSALLKKGWNKHTLTSRPLLDLPSLLEIIEKSEQ